RLPASVRRTRLSTPLPTNVASTSTRSGAMPSSMRVALAASARSGMESSSVPSRSSSAALNCVMSDARAFALGDLRAQGADDLGVVRLAEDGRAGHEGVGAGGADFGDVVGLDPAVDLQQDG